MLKLISKVLVVCLLLSLLISFVDQFFLEKKLFWYSIQEYEKEKGNIELTFFGSSHSFCSYNPGIFENELNLSSYNFGADAQRLVTTMPVIEKVLSENNVKLSIVDIFPMSIDDIQNENSKGLQLQTLDNLGYSIGRIKAYANIFDYKRMADISPTIRNHTSWSSNFKQEFILEDNQEFYKGFFTVRKFYQKDTWDKFLQIKENRNDRVFPDYQYKSELTIVEKGLIDDVIAKHKAKNIPLLFVSAPSYGFIYDSIYKRQQKLIGDYIESKHVKYIDFNKLWSKLNLNSRDFKDPNHLNLQGAIKVSEYLADFVRINYDLNSSKNLNLYNNRFFLIENRFKNVLIRKKNRNVKAKRITGVESVNIFNVSNSRYEVLFELDPDNDRRNIHLKLEYYFGESKDTKFGFLQNADRIYYNGKSYAIYQFESDLINIDKIKLFIGPKRDLQILNYKTDHNN